ncbi:MULTISPECIES: sulfate/molybdate ABC transporter ATP-binding protein [Bacillaceae]|uniref:sulfate/molybdate ABC transporter ATP-binding protein n=1 Tax=Bacillaceae TaxID=186817 RepID=UPI00066181FC|nr:MULTISPECIES: sulfate/molybdate ABC transporter ATP-binding protein [Bacillaceae]MCP1093608.1 sulfate/molybdate ABC transporter ATP-binding protein [Bacillaceae bacterium OS4b]MBD8587271.1 sulfate/molybdate ABC transporter ATP-binding protein [Peribacillus simplex]MCF7621456.1 sulfate/molybdate ABC transporter ATP-binding protein [Peribacillus frigoritolerans]MCM3165426.1 sulfate/molybdate ABC transporter ATP-binding protein [Peribacillus frigoritolerans]MCP1152111.1 sulfate/molybdate ABC t
MSIIIENVTKYYGSYQALRNIDLEIKSGELVALLGPSGSGKTSLLRIIAGLEQAENGKILFNEENYTHKHVKDRNVGFVFQHYALFRNMTIFDNIAYGLKVRPRKTRPSKEVIEQKVTELLQLVKLEGYKDRYPSQLSGGQRQRVALARALAVEPNILLLDEPFGALDAKVRKELRRWLRRLHDEFNVTSVFVTHDQEEAMDVADRVVIMNEGKIEQIGTPEEVYDHPENPFVYDFLGSVNLFKGNVHKGKLVTGNVEMNAPGSEDGAGTGYVRAHNFIIEREPAEKDSIASIIDHIHTIGPIVRIEVIRQDTNEPLEIELTKEQYMNLEISKGERVFVRPKELKVFVDFMAGI